MGFYSETPTGLFIVVVLVEERREQKRRNPFICSRILDAVDLNKDHLLNPQSGLVFTIQF